MTAMCSRWACGAVGLVMALSAGEALAGQPKLGTQPAPAKIVLTCKVQGTPVEFPDDILIRNAGRAVVRKGTKIHWQIPNTSRQGDYTFTADLAPGASKFLNGVLPGGHPAGATCKVTVKSAVLLKPAVVTPRIMYKLSCVVQGTPVEFPDDVMLKNVGASAIPAGKKIHWAIPNTSRKGDVTLTANLAPGATKFLSGVLPGGHPAGAACTATVVQ